MRRARWSNRSKRRVTSNERFFKLRVSPIDVGTKVDEAILIQPNGGVCQMDRKLFFQRDDRADFAREHLLDLIALPTGLWLQNLLSQIDRPG